MKLIATKLIKLLLKCGELLHFGVNSRLEHHLYISELSPLSHHALLLLTDLKLTTPQ